VSLLKSKRGSGRVYKATCRDCGGVFERKTNNKPYCDDCMVERGIKKRDPSDFDGNRSQNCKYCNKELPRSHYTSDILRYSFCCKEHEELRDRGFSHCLMCQNRYNDLEKSLQGKNSYAPFCSKSCRTVYQKLSLPLQKQKMKFYERIEARLLKATVDSLDSFIESVCKDIATSIKGE